jgi:dienelactone hydrolase
MKLLASILLASGLAFAGDPRADFLKMIDRPRVPLAPEIHEMTAPERMYQIHFTYASEAGERVPGILMRQAAPGRRPVAIALHGTGGNKEGFLKLLQEFSGKGFTAIAIDGRFHGERAKAGKGSDDYNDAILATWRTGKGHPFLYDTVWDLMRLIDYLETRDDVDPKRIGAMGISKGGMELYLAAAVDPRIAVAAPCIGVQSFRWALDNDSWQSRVGTFQKAINAAAKDEGVAVDAAFVRKFYDKVAPGIYGEFDGPAMLPLIAPRPLLSIHGDIDPRTPKPGVMECKAAADKAYRPAPDRFVVHFQENTAHQVKPAATEMVVAWLEKWLGRPQN